MHVPEHKLKSIKQGTVVRAERTTPFRFQYLTSRKASGGQPGSRAGRCSAVQPSMRRPP